MTYRLDVDGRGLEISFPAVDWAIAEYSDEAGEIWQVRIFRRPAIFNQVQIYLQDAPGRYDGLSKQLSLISEQGGGAPALLDGVAAQKYEDVEVGLIEGGIRMIGTVFVVASRGLLIKLALRSSIEANNENQTLIDTQETFSVFESLRFFAVEPAAGDRN